MSLVLVASRTVALLLVGLYAGGVFFVVIAPSVARMPGPAYVRYWQALNVDYGRAMPPLLLTGIAAMIVVSALSWRRGWVVFGVSSAALILVILTVALTLTGLEPLNRIADAWDPDRLPADWHQSRRRWFSLHLIRTALALAAFGCLIAAQALDRGPDPLVERAHVDQAASLEAGAAAAMAARGAHEGGSWGKQTGNFDCSTPGRPANAYARAQDVTSGRWSAGVPVRVGCSVY
ncbi:anthrone oxygenase family protein [Nonomuraea sp. JJY05]|uniref:anthrone oxygenase family protein n=1 Tax=Nonomuraea sp. JJY05 TaxID=3350255 RepID=UPI00373ECD6E